MLAVAGDGVAVAGARVGVGRGVGLGVGVGTGVGLRVGVGTGVGRTVGLTVAVGRVVGLTVGLAVTVGRVVGRTVGLAVTVGRVVGLMDGLTVIVGFRVGTDVGCRVGEGVASPVGLAVADGPIDGATDSVGVATGVDVAAVDCPVVVVASDEEDEALLPELVTVGTTVGLLLAVVPADDDVAEDDVAEEAGTILQPAWNTNTAQSNAMPAERRVPVGPFMRHESLNSACFLCNSVPAFFRQIDRPAGFRSSELMFIILVRLRHPQDSRSIAPHIRCNPSISSRAMRHLAYSRPDVYNGSVLKILFVPDGPLFKILRSPWRSCL